MIEVLEADSRGNCTGLPKIAMPEFSFFLGVDPGWTGKPRTAMRLAKYFMLDTGYAFEIGRFSGNGTALQD